MVLLSQALASLSVANAFFFLPRYGVSWEKQVLVADAVAPNPLAPRSLSNPFPSRGFPCGRTKKTPAKGLWS